MGSGLGNGCRASTLRRSPKESRSSQLSMSIRGTLGDDTQQFVIGLAGGGRGDEIA